MGKVEWEVRIPTAGGWWQIRKVDERYSVYFEATMSPGKLVRHHNTFGLLSEVYMYLAEEERKEE